MACEECEDDPLFEFVRRFREAERRALGVNSDDGRPAAFDDAKRFAMALVGALDGKGVLSEAYRLETFGLKGDQQTAEAADAITDQRTSLELNARVMRDIGSAWYRGPAVHRHRSLGIVLAATAKDIAGQLEGRASSGALKLALSRGRGAPSRPQVQMDVWRLFVQIVHFEKGRSGKTLPQVFDDMGVAGTAAKLMPYSTFEDNQSLVSQAEREEFEWLGQQADASSELLTDGERQKIEAYRGCLASEEFMDDLKVALTAPPRS